MTNHTDTPHLGSLALATLIVAMLLGPLGQVAARVASF